MKDSPKNTGEILTKEIITRKIGAETQDMELAGIAQAPLLLHQYEQA